VLSANSKIANAEKYYLKAIEINPKYVAYINLAVLKLEKEKTDY
jgi:hypothetical protein